MKKFLLLCFVLMISALSYGQFAVTTNSGSGLLSTYTSLANAIAALNLATISGPVVITCPTGTETCPAGGYSITATGTVVNTITIQGNGAANSIITAPNPAGNAGNLNDAIFKLVGSDYVTIQGFAMNENSLNLTTTAASNNMVEWGVALLYASTTNGAQNCTIQNNTITLNRTYQNTFGIYSNSTHAAGTVTTSATATTTAGGNSGLRIYGNTISNVNLGIVVVGPTAIADANTGIDIGGIGGGQANTITNFGTTGTFSSYANVSGTVNGILVRNSNGFNISYNIITSSNGGVTAGTLNGIQIPAATNAPTSTFTNSINYNILSLKSGVTSGTINGINIPSGSASATSILNINFNDFNNFGHTGSGTGGITFITNASAHFTQNINYNTFTNINFNTTGSVIFISNSTTLVLGGTKNINNNSIVAAFNKTGAGGTITLYYDNASSVTGSFVNNNNNNFSNITVTGATTIAGWANLDGGTPTKTVQNNTFNNWTCGSSAVTVLNVGYCSTGCILTGNTITNITGTGAITGLILGTSSAFNAYSNTINTLTSTGTGGAVIGLSITSGSDNVYLHNIYGLSSTGAAGVYGISVSGATLHNIYKNKVYNLSGSNASSTVYGIYVSYGTTTYLYNNFVSDLRTTVANAAYPLVGIYISGGTTIGAYYNTVYLNGTSSGVLFGSAAVYASTSPAIDMRDNVLVNVSTPMGAGITAAYRRSSTTLTTYASTSNANDFYAGATEDATHTVYYDGTLTYTLAGFQTLVGPSRDAVSFRQLPPFSNVATTPYDLHMQTSVATLCESGGLAISSPFAITDDFDGNTRTSTPDVGADEFAGIPGGVINPTLSAAVANSQQINLTLSTNPNSNNVVIVWNATGTFTTPSGTPPSVGGSLAGGTLIYNGTTSPYTHSGLTAGTAYYYKAFSYDGASSYSSGVMANAITGVAVPTALTATAAGSTQINLAYTKNTAGNDVIIATNSTSTFGSPVNGTALNVSDPITGGGTVIYKGPLAAFNHTGLTASTAYYYKVWSVDAYAYYSATGATANATTSCATATLPISQGFNASTIPSCWSQQYKTGTLSFTFPTTSTGNPAVAPQEGSNQVMFNSYNNSGSQTRLVSPPITTVGVPSVDVSFQWYFSSTGGATTYLTEGVQLQYSLDGSNWIDGGSLIRRYGPTNGWALQTLTLPAGAGNQSNVFVGFLFTSNAGYDSYFDAASIKATPSCVTPTLVNVTSVTSNSASINWTASVSNPASGYDIIYSTSATTPTTGSTPTASVGAGVVTYPTGAVLSSATPYYAWVRSNCGAGMYSEWTSVVTFTTACAAETAPTAVQDFSTYTGAAPNPICWSEATGTLAASSTLTYGSSKWLSEAGFANTGSNTAVRTNLYSTYNDWIISNPINLGGTAGLYRLKYDIAVTGYNATTTVASLGTHKVDIVVSTDGGNTWSNTNVIKEYTGAGTYSNTGQTETVNLTGYSGVVKIAFVQTTSSTSPDIDFHIDNFQVEAIPLCNEPTSVSVTSITTNSASINWMASSSSPSNGYDIYFSTSATAPTSGTTPSGSVGAGITTYPAGAVLSSATKYYVWVRSNCGGSGYSAWTSAANFTTLCDAVSSYPWSENFDAMSAIGNSIVPICWKIESGSGTPWASLNAAGSSYNDPSSAPYYIGCNYSPSSTDKYLITPAFNLTVGNSYDIGFKYAGDGYTGWSLDARINSTQTGTGSTMLGAAILTSANPSTSYTAATRTFYPAITGNYYFVIHVYNTYSPSSYIGFDDFTLTETAIPAPKITSLSSLNGCVGTSLIINGDNLGGASLVTIGGTPVVVTASSSTSITITVGTGTTGYVEVTTPGGMSTSEDQFTADPIPALYTVSGGGAYCAGGAGVSLGLNGSQIGVNYGLSTSPVTTLAGTGSALTFGPTAFAAGTYTVQATDATSNCSVAMTGSGTVTINAVPTGVTAVADPINGCVGNTINLTSSYASLGSTGMGAYVATRTTGTSYTSIIPATTITTWRNATSTDDNLSDNQPIGFNFGYNGTSYSTFRVSTNGFITFDNASTSIGSGSNPYSYANSFTVTSGGLVVAPNWDDLQTAGNLGTATDLNNSINYTTTGSVGSRVCTVEWANMQDFATGSTASYNFQVKLYEADQHIEFVYGTMTQSAANVSYSLGLSAATVSPTPTAAQLLCQTTVNTGVFGFTNQITLNPVPASNTKISFIPPVATYSWTGPNSFTSSAANPSISSATTNASGVYHVAVTNVTTGCSSSASTASVTVNALPTPSISGNLGICAGGSTTLDAGSYSSYIWSTGATTQTIHPSTAGSFTVTVTNSNNCSAVSAPVTTVVHALPTPFITGTLAFCSGGSTTLDAGSYSSYLWSTGATTQTIPVSIANTYTVTVTNSNGCSGVSAPVTTVVHALPTPSITGTLVFCAGGSTTLDAGTYSSYLWSTGATTQTIPVTTAGTFTVTVTNSNGCSGVSAPVTTVVHALPTPSITGTLAFCSGGSTTLDAGSYSSYLWSTGATTQTIPVSIANTYTVIVTNSNNCSAVSAPVTTVVHALPTPTVTGTLAFCSGSSTTLDAGSYSGYLWSTGAITQTIPVSIANTYTVTVTNSNNCSAASAPVTTIVNSLPTPSITGALAICSGSPTTLDAGSYSGYHWSTTATTQTISVGAADTYTLTVTDGNGCSGVSAPVTTIVNPLPTVTLDAAFLLIAAGNTTGNLSYSANTAGPITYSIDFDATANAMGFVDVNNVPFSGGTIGVTIPAGAAASDYYANVTVKNGNGCVSNAYPIVITVAGFAFTTSKDIGTALQITWTAQSGAYLYHFEYRISGNSTWLPISAPNNQIKLANVLPNTTYECYVRIYKNGLLWGSSQIGTFTTANVAYTKTQDIGTTAQISWNSFAPWASNYSLQYRKVGNPAWISAGSTSNQVKITNLIPNADYECQVRVYTSAGLWGTAQLGTFHTGVVSFNTSQDIGTTLLMDWTSFAWATNYTLQYRPLGGGSWVGGATTANQLKIGNLLPDTDYEFKLSVYKSGILWGVSGVTTVHTGAVVFTTVADNNTSMDLTWLPSLASWATSYQMQYCSGAQNPPVSWVNMTISSNTTLTISPIITGQDYWVKMRVMIGGVLWGVTKEQKIGRSTKMSSLIENNVSSSGMNIYPNPFVEQINLTVSTAVESTCTWFIYDMNGKVVKSGNQEISIGDNAVRIDASVLAKGEYILNTTIGNDKMSFRILKQ